MSYRLQYIGHGPHPLDKTYKTLAAAKAQLTRLGRRYRNFGCEVIGGGKVYRLDRKTFEITEKFHWVESLGGWTRVGADGNSEAHLVRMDLDHWGVTWHSTPCLAWIGVTDPEADMALADLILGMNPI